MRVSFYCSKQAARKTSRELVKVEVDITGGQEEIEEVMAVLQKDGHTVNAVLGRKTEETATPRGKRASR